MMALGCALDKPSTCDVAEAMCTLVGCGKGVQTCGTDGEEGIDVNLIEQNLCLLKKANQSPAHSALYSTLFGNVVFARSDLSQLPRELGPQKHTPRVQFLFTTLSRMKMLLLRISPKLAPNEPWQMYVPSSSYALAAAPAVPLPRSQDRTSPRDDIMVLLSGNKCSPGLMFRKSPASKLEMKIFTVSQLFRLASELRCTYRVRSVKRLGKQRSN